MDDHQDQWMEGFELLLLAHALATTALTGLIWFVQLVHYPLFEQVTAGFGEYHHRHMQRTGWVVIPPMFVELGTAVSLPFLVGPDLRAASIGGVVLLGVVWLATFVLQVPLHRRLSRGFDAATHRRLVVTNWARTALWSARVPVAFMLL